MNTSVVFPSRTLWPACISQQRVIFWLKIKKYESAPIEPTTLLREELIANRPDHNQRHFVGPNIAHPILGPITISVSFGVSSLTKNRDLHLKVCQKDLNRLDGPNGTSLCSSYAEPGGPLAFFRASSS